MGTWDDAERAALVALLRARPDGLTWPQIMGEVDARSSAVAFWQELRPPDLLDTPAPELDEAARDIVAWQAAALGFLTFLDDDYPAQLRAVHDLPPVLFHRGRLVPGDVAVSVVGSRNASARGLSIASSVAAGLVDRGISVASGLARGIDAAAHTATLEAGGRAVAVIGTGINRYYPKENRELQDRVAKEGLLLSQFWPDTPPGKHTFPMRNSVMSGYGRATVVVEAGETSGARIQARRAVAHGRVGANNSAHVMRPADIRGSGRRAGRVVGHVADRSWCAREGVVGERPGPACDVGGGRCSAARTAEARPWRGAG